MGQIAMAVYPLNPSDTHHQLFVELEEYGLAFVIAAPLTYEYAEVLKSMKPNLCDMADNIVGNAIAFALDRDVPPDTERIEFLTTYDGVGLNLIAKAATSHMKPIRFTADAPMWEPEAMQSLYTVMTSKIRAACGALQ